MSKVHHTLVCFAHSSKKKHANTSNDWTGALRTGSRHCSCNAGVVNKRSKVRGKHCNQGWCTTMNANIHSF